MARLAEDLVHRPALNDLARVHDRDPLAHLRDHGEVVRNEDDAQVEVLLKRREEGQDLVLDRHVECGRRLVAEDQLRVGREGDRDHDALAHPTGELVWIRLVPAFRVGDADEPHQLERPGVGVAAAAAQADERPLSDLVADAHQRVQRRHRLLEDHRDGAAAQLPQRRGVAGRDVDAVDLDRATGDPGGAWEQADERAQRHRLPGPGLADKAERLAGLYVERNAVDRAQRTARERELDLQVAYAQEGRHSGLNRSASPSASSESPSAVITTAIPGTVESSQCVVRYVWPSAIIRPQSAVGGWIPSPR